MNTTIKIRPAAFADIKQILMIQELRGLSPWSYVGYAAELELPDSVMLVAQMQDSPILGFIVGRMPALPDSDAELLNIGVLPNVEGRGVGAAMLERFLDLCRSRSARAVWLEVRMSNTRAIEFYGRHGFRRSGIRKNFYSEPVEDAILMSNSLAGSGI